MFRSKIDMVTADEALPGRDTPMVMPDDVNHPVLGNSIVGPYAEHLETIYVGMGCFWGAERIFWDMPGVHATAVGYMGGYTKHPTYEETCTARTGHTEAVMVVFDPSAVSRQQILKAFWENHNPTTPNRQGNDIGTQYRSAIFATSDAQLAAAQASAIAYQTALTADGYGSIATQIDRDSDAGDGVFYYAEPYHQAYLHKNPAGYCNHGFCQVAYNPTS